MLYFGAKTNDVDKKILVKKTKLHNAQLMCTPHARWTSTYP